MGKAIQADFNALLTRVEPLIQRIVKHRLRGWPRANTDDIAQQVRITLWERVFPKYDDTRGDIEPFVARAIHRIIFDELRKLATSRDDFILLPEEMAEDDQLLLDADERALKIELIREATKDLKAGDAKIVRALLRGASGKKRSNPHHIHHAKVEQSNVFVESSRQELLPDFVKQCEVPISGPGIGQTTTTTSAVRSAFDGIAAYGLIWR